MSLAQPKAFTFYYIYIIVILKIETSKMITNVITMSNRFMSHKEMKHKMVIALFRVINKNSNYVSLM